MGRLFAPAGIAIAILMLFACGDDPTSSVDPTIDAGTIEAGPNPEPGEPPPGDIVPPGKISDLAATAETHDTVKLTWTAPTDETGKATAYELKYAKTAIVDEATFAQATLAIAPTPATQGTPQTTQVVMLEADTEYHFVIRGRDAAGNKGPLSNDAVVKTKARASLLITEVALSNAPAEGWDFVELVATKAGGAQGIEIRQASGSIYKLGAFELAVGDRIVVHLTGLPGPTGFVQEDVAKSKTASTAEIAGPIAVHSVEAYDVYSSATGISASDNLIQVIDGSVTVDALAFSNRDGDAPAATMTQLANAKANGSWKLTDTPQDGTNDCATQREMVNIASTETVCGGFDADVTGPNTTYPSGTSINRNGLTDTNTKADFYIAAQTPGTANAAVVAPKLLGALATSATTVDLRFDQELAPATVVAGSFTLAPAIGVTAATLSAPNRVTLTTATQGDPAYVATIASTVTNTHGLAPTPLTARFCAFTATPAKLVVSEVNANIPSNADLVELEVTQGGPLAGFQVRSNPTSESSGSAVATLPGICAATGDFVVIHLTPAADPATSETSAKNENPAATYAFNYDGAWDVRGAASGLAMTNVVLAIRDPGGTWIDAAAFTNGTSPASAASVAALAFVQSLGLWLPADCGGAACTSTTAQSIMASWSALGNTAASSIRRTAATKDAAAWIVGPSTFGGTN